MTIVLVGTNGQGNAVSASTTTGANGEYAFTGLAPGTYTVSEQVPTGWTQTAGGATFTLTSGEEAVAYAGEAGTLLPGQTEVLTAGLAFGNHEHSVIVIGWARVRTRRKSVHGDRRGDRVPCCRSSHRTGTPSRAAFGSPPAISPAMASTISLRLRDGARLR